MKKTEGQVLNYCPHCGAKLNGAVVSGEKEVRHRKPVRLPEFLTVEEVRQVFAVVKNLRDKTLLELLYGCGLRASEVTGLAWDTIDLGTGKIKVLGKGNKERMVFLRDEGKTLLLQYQGFWDPQPDKRLFPMTRQQVWNIVKKYARKAKITKSIHPHTFRHTFATELLNNKMPMKSIQELLGHASLATTERYTHISTDKIQAEFGRLHPTAKFAHAQTQGPGTKQSK